MPAGMDMQGLLIWGMAIHTMAEAIFRLMDTHTHIHYAKIPKSENFKEVIKCGLGLDGILGDGLAMERLTGIPTGDMATLFLRKKR
jgi:hypothetical protein